MELDHLLPQNLDSREGSKSWRTGKQTLIPGKESLIENVGVWSRDMIAGLCLSNGSCLGGQIQKGIPAGKEQHVLKLRGMKCHREGQVLRFKWLEIREGDRRRCWPKKEEMREK